MVVEEGEGVMMEALTGRRGGSDGFTKYFAVSGMIVLHRPGPRTGKAGERSPRLKTWKASSLL